MHKGVKVMAFVASVFFAETLSAQPASNYDKNIHGTVFKEKSGGVKKVIGPGVDVFIPGVAEDKTDDLGRFSLDIRGCAGCNPGSTIFIYVNSEYGSFRQEYVVSNSFYNLEIVINENNSLMLTGLVRDEKTGTPLKGINVRALIDAKVSGVKTDKDGVFQIFIKKDNITNLQAITLSVFDSTSVYQSIQKPVYINKYGPIIIDLPLTQNETGKIKAILVEEVLNNLEHIDNRLQLIDYTLFLAKNDDFGKNLDSISNAIAPSFYNENRTGYKELIIKANIASLKQSLNSIPLRQEFGRSMVENLVNSGLKESESIFRYIDELNEVQRAEQILMESLESIAVAKDTCYAQLQRVSLSWLSLRNKAFFCNLYALQMINSLEVGNKTEINGRLSYHTYLKPNKLFEPSLFTKLLYQGTEEMYRLVEKKKKNVADVEQCRDRQLDKYNNLVPEITPEDTWENVIMKALIFRELGRYEEAIAAFEYYGNTFSTTDSTAGRYSKTAIAFTKEMHILKINGGVYIWKIEENSHAKTANILAGDILISINDVMINNSEDIRKYLFGIPPKTPLKLHLLRFNSEAHSFKKVIIEVPSKPIGINFMPI